MRIEAEMKTPAGALTKLDLSPPDGNDDGKGKQGKTGVDLDPSVYDSSTLQKILSFDLKEEGNHVLAVTVSYYEATEMSGRTRTFRKLYQFICKASLVVRTKTQILSKRGADTKGKRRWVLEAQLENCSEEAMQLERVGLGLERGWICKGDLNGWGGGEGKEKPVVKPGEIEQVCFVIEEEDGDRDGDGDGDKVAGEEGGDGRVGFGFLQIGWRGEMGNRGFLSTGRLGVRVAA